MDLPGLNHVLWTVFGLLLDSLGRILSNIYLHPLSRIPGPFSWASFSLPFTISLVAGKVVHDVERLHQKYGPNVRVSPNEVTFAAPEAWKDIFGSSFAKDRLWWRMQADRSDSLITTPNERDHMRMRKVFGRGFTAQALRYQEPFIQKYVALLVERLHDQAMKCPEGSDIVPWMNFTTFDIFGDIGFGDSFDCLQTSRYHPWISLLFNSVKAASFIIAARFYPWLETLLMMAIPKSLRAKADAHYQQIVDKVERRLNNEVERPDLMAHVMRQNHEDPTKGMSRGEINITFMVLKTAGSETTATCLSGIVNYLISNQDKLDILVNEVRTSSLDGTFKLASLERMDYLNAVIKEGLRLAPLVPIMLPRVVPKGGAVICGTWLPEGTSVSLQTWSLFRNPEYFHKASSFLPERWLPGTTEETSPFSEDRRNAFLPFSTGRHACLGRDLAQAEMRLVLARMLWHFDNEPAGPLTAWEDRRTYLLVEKRAVMVRIKNSARGNGHS